MIAALVIFSVTSIFIAGYFFGKFYGGMDPLQNIAIPSGAPDPIISNQGGRFMRVAPDVTLKPLENEKNESKDLSECADQLKTVDFKGASSVEELRDFTDLLIDLCMKKKGYTNYWGDSKASKNGKMIIDIYNFSFVVEVRQSKLCWS